MADISLPFTEAPQANGVPKYDSNGGLQANLLQFFTGIINNGHTRVGYATVAGDTTITATKGDANNATVFFVNNAAADRTMTLPDATTCGGRILIFVVLSSSHNCVLDGYSTQTVNGGTTKTSATAYNVAIVMSDGSNFLGLLSGTWT